MDVLTRLFSRPPEQAVPTAELTARVEALTLDPAPLDEYRFGERATALDVIEFDILEGIRSRLDALATGVDGSPASRDIGAEIDLLRAMLLRMEAHQGRLERIDREVFERLRTEVRKGLRGARLRSALARYINLPASGEARAGYDELDDFLTGLLLPPPVPEAARPLQEGMVFYQPTPARVILELIHRAGPTANDLFIDVGSGLGLVAILVHLLTGARTLGIEVDPAYHRYAVGRLADLGIGRGVEFLEADARVADYSEGDVIFLYTPFSGAMLGEMLVRLRDSCGGRQTRLFSFGPCNSTLASQPWLKAVGPVDSPDRLAEFTIS